MDAILGDNSGGDICVSAAAMIATFTGKCCSCRYETFGINRQWALNNAATFGSTLQCGMGRGLL